MVSASGGRRAAAAAAFGPWLQTQVAAAFCLV